MPPSNRHPSSLLCTSVSVLLLIFCSQLRLSQAHGLMTDPPQRGTLNPSNHFNHYGTNRSAPNDPKPHFPAGNKSPIPGSAARSQIAAVPSWKPFDPTSPSFQWRASVCGDSLTSKSPPHLRGGEYYGGGQISRTFQRAATIPVSVNIIGHHNGFIEMHVCDIARCNGEISTLCFKQGHCHPLLRAPNPSCDSGRDRQCGPIDPNYPTRWYLPCSTKPENIPQDMGGHKMIFQLPPGLVCQHCVLHWFWSAANSCNPPGVIDYFTGPQGPRTWGNCPGQSGAKGGYAAEQKDCGPDTFPEEYYQCADIRILSHEAPKANKTPVLVLSDPTKESKPSKNLSRLELFADGDTVGPVLNGRVTDISDFSQVTIQAITTHPASKVLFYIDDSLVWTDYKQPYFMFGNNAQGPSYWESPETNQFFTVKVVADDDVLERRIMWTKRF